MTLPAPKRRKTSHESDEETSESTSANLQSKNDSEGDQIEHDDEGLSDVSLQDAEEFEDEQFGLDEDEEEDSGEAGGRAIVTSDRPANAQALRIEHNKKLTRTTANSLQNGAYTAEVYKSNVFKFQVDDLLQQVKAKYGKKEASAENAMRSIKELIERLPSREPLLVPEAQKKLKSEGIVVPFPSPPPPQDAKYKVQYVRPASINVTGSYPLKIATRVNGQLRIDLVVTMPKTLFQEKDYLNYRYFYRRAYYLACIAAGLKNSKEYDFKISFGSLNGNSLQPILLVEGIDDKSKEDSSSSKYEIRILLAAPEDTFAENKLRPTSNCLRLRSSDDASETQSGPATPFYNASIQSELSMTAYLKLLYGVSSRCDGFKDACILGRIWLRQRGLAGSIRKGGFGNFEWAAIMAVLLNPMSGAGSPVLSTGYSSYQLFKATLHFLARHNLVKSPFISQYSNAQIPKQDDTPVFFDGPRHINLLFKMTPWSFAYLQREAQQTVDMLRDSVFDQFEATFVLKTDVSAYHDDALLEIPISALGLDPADENYERNFFDISHKIYTILKRALNDRVIMLRFLMADEVGWKLSSRKPFEDQQNRIIIAFETNPANAYRTVDHGPAAEDKKDAASFRQFWGEKSELRRFKDGRIVESVVWSVKDRVSIIELITRYILGKHIGPNVANGVVFTHDAYSQLIPSGQIQGQSGVSIFSTRMTALANLEKAVRDLEGLPLTVRHISAADPQLRYTAVDIESAKDPMAIVIQFEGSTRWPDDLCAIQRTKIAFLLKLLEVLEKEKEGYTSRVGLENSSHPSQNQGYLDILLESGFTFRLRIHHDREATLLERQIKDKSLNGQSREAAAAALAAYKRGYIHTPAHSQALQTMCTRHPALSPSIRLTKRWFASHLLSAHFSPEFIELLVARTFFQPYPWQVPSCATTGFLRTLFWISRWDWRHAPLIVDFSSSDPTRSATSTADVPQNGLRSEDIEGINTRFEAWRRIDPAMNHVTIFAATNLDRDGTTWADKGKPEKVVASRMTALAKAATEALRADEEKTLLRISGNSKEKTGSDNHIDPATLFTPQFQDFDFVIRLSPKFTKHGKKSKYKNLALQQDSASTSDPSQHGANVSELFARDIEQIYGDSILWFWNPEDLSVIAGLWNPVATAQRGWKVKTGWNSVPLSKKKGGEEVDVELNKGAICNEIKRLGGDLITEIEVL